MNKIFSLPESGILVDLSKLSMVAECSCVIDGILVKIGIRDSNSLRRALRAYVGECEKVEEDNNNFIRGFARYASAWMDNFRVVRVVGAPVGEVINEQELEG